MLTDIAIFLAAAVVAVPISARVGLGTVLGYLAAGILIGPGGLGLIHQVEETMHFAEFGVVLLLFLIGLELQPSRLWRMRGSVFGMGGAQVGATAVVLTALGVGFGLPWRSSLVAALGLAMSSTAFALQMLGEKNELARPHGRASFGVLLFQDLAAIPTLALVPLLGPSSEATAHPGRKVLITVGVLVGLIVAGRYLLRPLLRFIASARSHELSAAATLLVVIGTSLLMHAVGLSMALGSFMAGVLLADSEYRHELEANIEPFKGLLLGLFFIAVGMSANLRVLVRQPLLVLGLVALLTAVKFGVLVALGRAFKQSWSSATSLGITLSQGGEFAFVIFGVAAQSHVLAPETIELLVVVVTLSMAVTPLLFLLRDRVETYFEKGDGREFDAIDNEQSRVIIAGFGRFGQIVARVLRVRRIPFTALEINPVQVDFVRRFGSQLYYGDASRVDILRAAHTERADLFVLAIDDMEASLRTAKVVQQNFPNAQILARARNRQHAYALYGLGIKTVVRENFAGSLDLAQHALEGLGFSTGTARSTVRKFGQYDDEQVRRMAEFREDEKALIASAKEYARELERIFQEDEASEAEEE